MVRVIPINSENREAYEAIMASELGNSITQSLIWGVMQQRFGRASRGFVAINEQQEVLGSIFLTVHPEPGRRCFLYANRGPIFDPAEEEVLKALLVAAAQVAKETRAIFLRIDPALIVGQAGMVGRRPASEEHRRAERARCPSVSEDERGPELNEPATLGQASGSEQPAVSLPFGYVDFAPTVAPDYLTRFGFQKAHASHQPEHTLVLDLYLSEAELLAQMKPKGRYNIRLSQKKGVIVRESKDIGKDLPIFLNLLAATTKRDGFQAHPAIFYKNMLETLRPLGHATLLIAEYQGQPLAALILTLYGNKVTYYYGASANEQRELMAPYLLQWEAIRLAKQRGFHYYDFLGISLPHDPYHPWAGVTEFKRKFGGQRLDFIGTYELVYNPFWYWLMIVSKKLLKIWRRLVPGRRLKVE